MDKQEKLTGCKVAAQFVLVGNMRYVINLAGRTERYRWSVPLCLVLILMTMTSVYGQVAPNVSVAKTQRKGIGGLEDKRQQDKESSVVWLKCDESELTYAMSDGKAQKQTWPERVFIWNRNNKKIYTYDRETRLIDFLDDAEVKGSDIRFYGETNPNRVANKKDFELFAINRATLKSSYSEYLYKEDGQFSYLAHAYTTCHIIKPLPIAEPKL
jgi:hypothetical protein